jgi:hypothetical protein
MACACIRDTYDFDLNQADCTDIIYQDRSTFQAGPQYTSPPFYTLNVTDPGGVVKTYEVTSGIPLHLNLGKCLEPGVYTFSVDSCTENFTKKVAILCSIECGYLRAITKIGKGVDVDIVRSIRERIEYAKLSTSFGDINTARELVQSIILDIRRINCECTCF